MKVAGTLAFDCCDILRLDVILPRTTFARRVGVRAGEGFPLLALSGRLLAHTETLSLFLAW